MPIYKCTLEFTSTNAADWEEVYYLNSGSAAQAAVPSGAFLAGRLGLLHPLNNWVRTRTSGITANRDTAQFPVGRPGTAPSDGGPAVAGAAAVIGLGSAAGGTRKLWLRGLPGPWIRRSGISGQDFPPADLQVALQAFFAALVGDEYGLLRRSPVNGINVVATKVNQVDGTAKNGVSIITTQTPHGLTPGVPAYFGKFSKKDLPALQGSFTVIAPVSANAFSILYNTPAGQLVFSAQGYVKLIDYTGVSVFSGPLCKFLNYGTRSTHVPLFHSRGARRAARLRPSL